MTILTWEEKAQAKQASAAAKIPAEWRLPASIQTKLTQDQTTNVLDIPAQSGILTARELEITETTDATSLLAKLANQEYTSVEVTTAFCKRAAIAQQLTNCLTETFFDVALTRAKELDDHLATTGTTLGPFHGLPISLKESFNITGIPTSLGFISWLDRPIPTANSTVVEVLLAAGAVLYVKTNIPQTMMTAESHNNVFGRTLNPYRLNLTAGGSTGGEGALIALRGSLLGVGSDIGGSIRIPSICCGITGFKPTAGRVPFAGQPVAGRRGLTGIAPVAGPLCHSIRDADLFMRVMAESNPDDLDDMAFGIPWSQPPLPANKPLAIGLLPEDPARPYHPNMQRTLTAATKKLAAAGHRIIDLAGKTPSLQEVGKLAFHFFNMDPDRTLLGHVTAGGEPVVPSLKALFPPDSKEPEPTLRELYDINIAKADICVAMRKVFLENGLDVILGAGYQSCAVPHDTFGVPLYTLLPNLVDYPASIIPFGKAEEVADKAFVRDVEYIPEYNPKEVEGAPCHVQLIGRRLKDEKLVQHSKVIEDILRAP
ncbi:amidase signature domain-containing protein [Aspergillus leporis]|uniref:Amidase signature domain-containing protein n=1 Tax=Aspergillus leporis TaxID=41062 RepID=A0A5N5WR35_9EURO|nr:amidase signature domain-containing protein [Aspergillus leporis]